jgi:RHH-type transcriptional regulator, proline utilization regulon repressor / proline dehydrogenase / delta 1-pyrroline-5-carboxylate dehydrogenase
MPMTLAQEMHGTRSELPGRDGIAEYLLADEAAVVRELVDQARVSPDEARETEARARHLVEAVRRGRRQAGGIDEFMQEYALSSEEGVVLMCLAEALLRIPDAATADKLIADKIGGRQWDRHIGHSDSLFVNASAWGLMLTGRFIELSSQPRQDVSGYLRQFAKRSGEPVVRSAMRRAMRIMGKHFVLGRTIEEALTVAKPMRAEGYRFSFDMLGEAAMTMADADRYYAAYMEALRVVARQAGKLEPGASVFARPSLSVKLSAIHPRYQAKARGRLMDELLPRLIELAQAAKSADLGLTIDAEEADRLDLQLEIFAKAAAAPELAGWDGLGLAVQGYSKRCYQVLKWLAELAEATGRKLPVRLVKGAYWDTEIKRAQEAGLAGYPVFTRKVGTDVSYLACAKLMLARRDVFYPQFATHNAHTLAAVSVMAGEGDGYEFQRLHGMGQALYAEVLGSDKLDRPCRIYAPVGSHEDLLAYLVRRLLENGANTSFVNRLADDEAPIEDIIADPVREVERLESIPHPSIPLPTQIFAPRVNSRGLPLWDNATREPLVAEMQAAFSKPLRALPIVAGKAEVGEAVHKVVSPQDRRVTVGEVSEASDAQVDAALTAADVAWIEWDRRGGAMRARILEKVADLYEANTAKLMALLVIEAGKSLDNALSDLREAVDFLRYYATRARAEFAEPLRLGGPTGEANELTLAGRGVFVCISPWNFPLAIFTGQMTAALAAGNAVIAKPAEQTPLVAFEAVKLFHQAGVPGEVLSLLPGDGARLGKRLLPDPRVAGVAFTGSNETASIIHRTLAERKGAIVPFIAETGGINAMIVDSSALPEQAVRDVVLSAFDSAGQRCSAARVLFVQEDIADKLIAMLKGAIAELKVGDPADYATDVGPVIDEDARRNLDGHKDRMRREAATIIELEPAPDTAHGIFVAPAAYEIGAISVLEREVFGPILHVVRYRSDQLHEVCEAINNTGYGLTLGLHTRIERTMEEVRRLVRVGNLYVNRNQIGAVVGAQPFGGEGLSGTGPKAGGPHYLHRFATERVVSVDTTALGGNAALLSLAAEERR